MRLIFPLNLMKNTAIYVSEVMGREGNPCKYFAPFSLTRFLADNERLRVKSDLSDCSFINPIYIQKINLTFFILLLYM